MNKLKQTLEKALKSEPAFFDSESGELNYTKVKDSADKIDKKLISLLADNKDLKNKFFTKIKDVYVFNIQDFKFFLDESKVDNSYTQYANKIGLADNSGLLENRSEVVLDFPFKDCVLEGGQSTEEGTDTYFEFSDKTGKYEEKNGKRNEVFFNQVLAHDEIDRLYDRKALVNWKRFTKDSKKDGEAVKEIKRDKTGLIQENLIIKGNNLLALHSLKSEFVGKIKLIYIDPPYNTGSDTFAYNDNFNHSTWLTFIKNRLEIAKDLLKQDGAIFVQIDSREQAYLKILMDNIFGRDNFLSCINVKSKAEGGVGKEDFLLDVTEYILCYSKNSDTEFNVPKEESDFNPDNEKNYKFILESIDDGKLVKTISGGKVGDIEVYEHKKYKIINLGKKERILKTYIENFEKIYRTTNPQGGLMKRVIPQLPESKDSIFSIKYLPSKGKNVNKMTQSYFINKGLVVWFKDSAKLELDRIIKFTKKTNFWDENIHQGISNEGAVTLLAGKKPEKLIQNIIEIGTEENDLVLDYHVGSGTTCAVAHKMNRQYIGIEQLDYGDNDSVARLKNVIKGDTSGISKNVNWKGGGEFIYCELAKWNEKAKEEIQNAKDLPALVKLFDTLYEKYFLNYNVRIKDFKDKIIKEENFKKLTLAQQKKMFLTMLDLNQMYVQESEMADKKYGISSEDQKLTKAFYSKK